MDVIGKDYNMIYYIWNIQSGIFLWGKTGI